MVRKIPKNFTTHLRPNSYADNSNHSIRLVEYRLHTHCSLGLDSLQSLGWLSLVVLSLLKDQLR